MAMVTTPGMLLDILDVLEILSDFGLVRRTASEYLRLPLMVPAKDAASVAMVGG